MTTLDGPNINVHFLVNNPELIQRVLSAMIAQQLTGHQVLTGRVNATGTGAAIFNTEPAFADDEPEQIAELAEYPLTTFEDGTPSIVTTDKWGLATDLSQEVIARNRLDVLKSRLLRMAATITSNFDRRAYSVIGSAVTDTHPAAALWGTSAADPLLDVLSAGAKLEEKEGRGYKADTIIATPTKWAQLVAATKVLDATPREAASSNLLTGNMVRFAGLNIIKTTHFTGGTNVMVVDSRHLGSIVYENLGGGYRGNPADAASAESKVIPLDKQDGTRIQVRKVNVPWVQESSAGVKLTGA